MRCFDCGSLLTISTGPNREFFYKKDLKLILPDDFEVPYCSNCDERWWDEELIEKAKGLANA